MAHSRDYSSNMVAKQRQIHERPLHAPRQATTLSTQSRDTSLHSIMDCSAENREDFHAALVVNSGAESSAVTCVKFSFAIPAEKRTGAITRLRLISVLTKIIEERAIRPKSLVIELR